MMQADVQIKFDTKKETEIADALWNASSEVEVRKIIKEYGATAVSVMNMMVAAVIDKDIDKSDLSEAKEVLSNY